jgi:hypothetical protein
MSFAQALHQTIADGWDTARTVPLYFLTAPNIEPPYAVLQIVAPTEQPEVLCEDQGDAGNYLFQFSGVASDRRITYNMLEDLKTYVQGIAGTITLDGTTYRITENQTDGVREFDASLGTWQCIFESRFRYSIV